jgi:chemotaxis protein CheD
MSGPGQEPPVIYLKAGEMHFSEHSVVVLTVLGSCLSVTMFHRKSAISAVCHGFLPECRGRQSCDDGCIERFKYVDCSIRKMLKLFDRRDVKRCELEIKVFGGADMFETEPNGRGTFSVGKLNISTAKKILEQEGMRIVSMDVGGTRGRKLYFHTRTGEVLLKRLQPRVILAGNGAGK